jgi:hypothetical protein
MLLEIIDLFKLEIVIYLMSVPMVLFGFIIVEMIKEHYNEKNPSK